jgi:hypothetical protein
MRLSHLFAALFFLPLGVVAASCDDASQDQPLCDAGSNVFCRCRGGGAGTKKCKDDGDGFGACETSSGECEEIDDPTGSGSGGGEPIPPPPGELLGPCSIDSDCKDGMVCPMGYCTKSCASYAECDDGDCVNWMGSALCMPYCITQKNCETFGMASRCGYTDDVLPPFDVVVCANWGDDLAFPPDGYPPTLNCFDDAICNLGFEGVERVCGPGGCTDGCHGASDCPDMMCSSSDPSTVGSCGTTTMEDGDDCPGIPLTASPSSGPTVQGDTGQALPPSEHSCASPCVASMNPPSEELVYAIEVTTTRSSTRARSAARAARRSPGPTRSAAARARSSSSRCSRPRPSGSSSTAGRARPGRSRCRST